VGGSVEVRLWGGFAAEADFLYRFNGSRFQYGYGPGILPDSSRVSINDRERLHVFEVPVLGKYYFRHEAKLQPFVLTGYSLRKALADSRATVTTETSSGVTSRTDKASYWTPLDVGANLGAGLRWRHGGISFTPEFRYTWWGSQPNRGVSRHQGDFLLGITF
jgi:hypothetical protein